MVEAPRTSRSFAFCSRKLTAGMAAFEGDSSFYAVIDGHSVVDRGAESDRVRRRPKHFFARHRDARCDSDNFRVRPGVSWRVSGALQGVVSCFVRAIVIRIILRLRRAGLRTDVHRRRVECAWKRRGREFRATEKCAHHPRLRSTTKSSR